MPNFRKFYPLIGVIIVALLILIVALNINNKKLERTNSKIETQTTTQDTVIQEKQEQELIKKEAVHTDTVAQVKIANETLDPPTLADDILATVNNVKITKQQLDSMLDAMPSQIKEYYKDDKPGFLEELITRQLLIGEAKRQKIDQDEEYKNLINQYPDKKDDVMVNLLLKKIASNVTLSEDELRDFFNQYKDQLPNKDYEAVKEQLRPMAIEEKQRLKIEELINNLKAKAKIVRNERWVKEQEALTADNPLSKALKTKRPVLVDFGRGTCIPCKMMQPILEKLQKDYVGKAEILILDVGEYASLARKYKIMVIPTQIFFDSSGKEVYRHQGFMPEQDIIAQLKKLGVKE